LATPTGVDRNVPNAVEPRASGVASSARKLVSKASECLDLAAARARTTPGHPAGPQRTQPLGRFRHQAGLGDLRQAAVPTRRLSGASRFDRRSSLWRIWALPDLLRIGRRRRWVGSVTSRRARPTVAYVRSTAVKATRPHLTRPCLVRPNPQERPRALDTRLI
jgi:hypothetical protein